MNRFTRFVSILLTAGTVTLTSFAVVVTDNNLAETTFPDLANAGNDFVTYPLTVQVQANRVYVLQNDIESTVTGYDISPYNIQALSKIAAPTSTVDLISPLLWGRTYGNAYPKQQWSVQFSVEPGISTLYFGLAFGRFDAHKAANYRWLASNIRLLTHQNADAGLIHPSHGNLVPNASFEDPTAKIWGKVGSPGDDYYIIETNAVHGSHAFKISGTENIHIGIPVIPGMIYDFSFWSASPEIGNGHQIEYGFSTPLNGWEKGADNSSVYRYQGDGNRPWTEYTGSFTPEEGQTMWYLGGMATGGYLLFDSIYLARRSYPGTIFTIH